MFNLSDDENNVEWLIQGGMLPVLLDSLAKGTPDVQRLAASTLANVAISPQIRLAAVESVVYHVTSPEWHLSEATLPNHLEISLFHG